MTERETTESPHDDAPASETARRYLRAVTEHEANQERLLAEWAEEYYEPGFLRTDEWEELKAFIHGNADWDVIESIVTIAIYRRALTEMGEATVEDDWPAAPGGCS